MRLISSLLVAALAGSAAAVTIDNVTIRQDWPWSPRVEVSFELADVEYPVNVGVEAYDGAQKLDAAAIAATVTGDHVGLAQDGAYSLSIDVGGCVARKLIGDFKVKLTADVSDPSYLAPLYKVYDLTTGACEVITPAKILSGAYGSYRWRNNETPELGPGDPVPYVDLIWTGVAEDDKYKTTHLAMRYLAAKGETVYKLGYVGSAKTMKEDFYLAVFETTIAQWETIAGARESWPFGIDSKLPANGVSYDEIRGKARVVDGVAQCYFPQEPDAESFMGKLRAKTSAAFDLPCQHEWNYAWHAKSQCIGTSSTMPKTWNDGTPGDQAAPGWYSKAVSYGPTAVGQFNASNQGLYDMHGNVYEWCGDWGFTTQGDYRNWDAVSSVDPDDPTQVAAGCAASTSYRMLLGGSFFSSPASGLMLNTARKYLASSAASRSENGKEIQGDMGFRVRLPSDFALVETGALAGSVAGESAAIEVIARPDETYLWRTLPAGDIDLAWSFPKGGSPATLAVTGIGYSKTYENLTEGGLTLSLPAASRFEENVYDLVLTFADGSVKSARLGRVTGSAVGGEATTKYVPATSGQWSFAPSKSVLPIPFGFETLSVGGTEVDTGLGGAAGWFGLDLTDKDGETVVLGEWRNVLLKRDVGGLVLLFR